MTDMQAQSITVSEKTLTCRIRRVLGNDYAFRKARRGNERLRLGMWYVAKWPGNRIVERFVNIEEIGRRLKVLKENESLTA